MEERWVKVAAAPDESVALLMGGVLKDAGTHSAPKRPTALLKPPAVRRGDRKGQEATIPCDPTLRRWSAGVKRLRLGKGASAGKDVLML